MNFFQSVIPYWFLHSTSALLWFHCRSEKRTIERLKHLLHLFQKLGVMWSISQKLPWRHSLHSCTGVAASAFLMQRKKPNQNQSSPCATRLRPTRIFSKVSVFQQTLQVFGTRGKRSSRWLPLWEAA